NQLSTGDTHAWRKKTGALKDRSAGRKFNASRGSERVTQRQQDRPARHGTRRIEAGVVHLQLLRLVIAVAIGRQRVDVLALVVDTGVAGQGSRVVRTDIAHMAPVAVEQVQEVVDVQADDALVALEQARDFLLDRQVDAIAPRRMRLVAMRDLTAMAAE